MLFLLVYCNVTDPELRPWMMDPIRHVEVSNARRRFFAPREQANLSAATAARNTVILLQEPTCHHRFILKACMLSVLLSLLLLLLLLVLKLLGGAPQHW